MVVAPKKKRRELTPVEMCKIWTLHLEGYNPTQIVSKTGTPGQTVSGVIARQTLCPDTSFESKPRSGCPKKISQRGARALVRTVITDTRMTLKALATPSKSGKQIHY
jgi:hypothetical protein